jgi:hypothetical protein
VTNIGKATKKRIRMGRAHLFMGRTYIEKNPNLKSQISNQYQIPIFQTAGEIRG